MVVLELFDERPLDFLLVSLRYFIGVLRSFYWCPIDILFV